MLLSSTGNLKMSPAIRTLCLCSVPVRSCVRVCAAASLVEVEEKEKSLGKFCGLYFSLNVSDSKYCMHRVDGYV